MQRPLAFHPRPLSMLLALVLCLAGTSTFAQRRIGPSTPSATGAGPAAAPAGPAPSGLTSGAAPGLTAGMPSASGLTSGSGALPIGAPAQSGLTSGTSGAVPGTSTTPTTTGVGDPIASTFGGSTRGVVVLPAAAPLSFDEMDTNRDGVVSRAEYEASRR